VPQGNFSPVLADAEVEKMKMNQAGAGNGIVASLNNPGAGYLVLEDMERQNPVKNISKDEFSQVKEAAVVLAGQVMNYFSFDNENSGKENLDFQMENRINTSRFQGNAFDFHLTIGVGYEKEPKSLILSKIKVSAYGFSTYLDAVYDYQNEGLELILSNSHVNTLLMDNMKLEVQISSTINPGGALYLTMSF
jgi:hypothetical protein